MKKHIEIDGRIDLHGYTQDQAYSALQRFFSSARLNNKKNLLVITGKGAIDKPCIMKVMVPRWLTLTDLKQYVSSYKSAPISLGGEGALVVTIKRL